MNFFLRLYIMEVIYVRNSFKKNISYISNITYLSVETLSLFECRYIHENLLNKKSLKKIPKPFLKAND